MIPEHVTTRRTRCVNNQQPRSRFALSNIVNADALRMTAIFLERLVSRQEEHSGSRVTAAQVQKDVLKLALHFERDFRACMLAETGTRFAGGHAPSSGLLGVTLLLGTHSVPCCVLPKRTTFTSLKRSGSGGAVTLNISGISCLSERCRL